MSACAALNKPPEPQAMRSLKLAQVQLAVWLPNTYTQCMVDPKNHLCWVTMDTRISRTENIPMQHLASSSLSWLECEHIYELSAAKPSKRLRMTSETSAWFAWLGEISSFAFHGQ